MRGVGKTELIIFFISVVGNEEECQESIEELY